ncbi:MAG: ABC transporter permease [Candidatus Acidiferrales bacterium]
MKSFLQDLRYAIRICWKNPGFAATAVLSLAIGIGANAAIFSVANALLLRPLPYKDADRLAILWNRSPGLSITQDWFSTAQYFDIKARAQSFEDVAIAIGGNFNLIGDGNPERIGAVRVSSNLLPMLGARVAEGSLFSADADTPGQQPSAVLTYGIWERHYGRDQHMIGRSLTINGVLYTVTGILTRGFALPREVLPTLYGTDQAEAFLPLPLDASAAHIRIHEDYNIVGRLKRGVSIAQAQAEMDTLTAQLRHDFPESYPPNGGLTFGVVPLLEQVVGDVRRPLYILLAAVGFVLLIACANVANLFLSSTVARQKEVAVRRALGASNLRIVRQLLTEAFLLSLCGGVLGVLLSSWSVDWIHLLGAKSVPRLSDIHLDWLVLLYALGVSVLAGCLFGIAPALRLSRLDLNKTLKDTGPGSAGASALWGRRNNMRRLLVISELALCVVLLIGAGLLIRSFSRLIGVSPGFNPEKVLTFDLTMTGRNYADTHNIWNAYRQLWERFDHLPGVINSGGISSIPLSDAFAWTPITVEGRTPLAGEKFINADIRIASGNYFQAMEIPLRHGRFFNENDSMSQTKVVLVDEFMAGQLWPGQDAVGKRIHIVENKSDDPWHTVVGVVGRVKQDSLDSNPRIAFYVPQTQYPVGGLTIVVQTNAAPAALVPSVRDEIRAVDSDLPMYDVRTMQQRVSESLARRRFAMALLGVFATLALVLAVIGVYGVIAYLVSQGKREIGIRIALGATKQNILALIVRQGMLLALAGCGIGLAVAFALTRLMRSLLFGVSATDALTFTAIPAVLILAALLASYIPARRATRIDPLISIRCE